MNLYKHCLITFGLLLLISICQLPTARAAGFNEGGGGGASITIKLDPFVVNLAAYDHFLQATITLKLDAPEVSEEIKTLMPKIRHAVIFILSSKDSETMRSTEGKMTLIKELKSKINKALNAKEHEGVGDVFLEKFVIQ
jgi:flagellar FliL protein